MRTELNEMNATHNRMESLVYNLADDLRELRSAANMQFMQFQTTTAELKQKTDKISHDNKKVADKIRAHQVKGGGKRKMCATLRGWFNSVYIYRSGSLYQSLSLLFVLSSVILFLSCRLKSSCRSH